MNWWTEYLLLFGAAFVGLIFLIILAQTLNWCLMLATGGAPKPQLFVKIRHYLKRLRRIRPVSRTIECADGYLYYAVTYSDGSVLHFR